MSDPEPIVTDEEFIEREVLKLPIQERARLAEVLISSLDEAVDESDPAEIEAAWIVEADRRLQEILAGNAVTIPADKVMRKLRS